LKKYTHETKLRYLNVITISESTKLLLASCVPDIEANGSSVCVKHQWMYLNSQSSNILLLELTCQVPLDKGGFASTSIANKDKLEGGHIRFSSHDTVSTRV